ncbi:hypothetical protein AXG93_815s1500 [Marchantia polymorpha subsp. ruderalis]|uniref:Uncharacterized protein n=1 Tax=Marchantia polymorpha subsp. ruderalis TaxID=1480154 RepID=A0A176W0A5_MARPO|nr:hypothetical protein AXG93_815s1500 [Marchantia polymorpha subsp. ruderalis]
MVSRLCFEVPGFPAGSVTAFRGAVSEPSLLHGLILVKTADGLQEIQIFCPCGAQKKKQKNSRKKNTTPPGAQMRRNGPRAGTVKRATTARHTPTDQEAKGEQKRGRVFRDHIRPGKARPAASPFLGGAAGPPGFPGTDRVSIVYPLRLRDVSSPEQLVPPILQQEDLSTSCGRRGAELVREIDDSNPGFGLPTSNLGSSAASPQLHVPTPEHASTCASPMCLAS